MATTTVNAIKVGNTSVSTVIVNGITVFKTASGTTQYKLGNIYINSIGFNGNTAYPQVRIDSIPSGLSINVVCATGTSYNSSTYTLSGNLQFAYGQLTSSSSMITLQVPNSSRNKYCMLGLTTSHRDYRAFPLMGDYMSYDGKIYYVNSSSGSYKLPVINIPYGSGTPMGGKYLCLPLVWGYILE